MSVTRGFVARLVAEFAIIVIGVLVALAVDAWVDDRSDRQLEGQILSELHAELDSLRFHANRVIEFDERVTESLERLISGLSGSELPPSDSLTEWYLDGIRSPLYRPSAAIADALFATGDIALVRDTETRRLITTHYQRVRQVSSLFDIFDEAWLDGVAVMNQRVHGASASGTINWALIASRGSLRGDLVTQRTIAENRAVYVQYLVKSVDPLVAALERALPKSRMDRTAQPDER